jgi:phosphoglycerate dehydrogenase-like enzyme
MSTAARPIVLYSESRYADDSVEKEILGKDMTVRWRDVDDVSDLKPEDCADVEGLMVMRHGVTAADFKKFPKLRCVVRMGVGYDKVDRKAAEAHGVMVCNVPDYGTTEVADHAMALALSLRRGVLLHHEAQRRPQPAPWRFILDPLVKRSGVQTFGIIGLGRIGTAVALRAKAFQFNVVVFDPHMPNGTELGVGVKRVRKLEDLMEQTDTLSIHAPLTPETRGMVSRDMMARMPKGAIVVNTARGPIVDVDGLADLLKRGHLAGAALDVLPVEPPVDPIPEILRAYRAREPWTEGRLVITPHSAFHTPNAEMDTRIKAAETIRAALLTSNPQNVITPDMF